MRFTKIRIANKQVELAWEERDGETKKTHGLASPEPPTPAFVDALRGMSKHLPLLTDADDEYLESAEVRGVSISSDKADRRTLTMAAVRPVAASNSPLNINTPAITETEEVRDGSLFGDVAKIREVFDDFDALAVHAKGFLNGERGEEPKEEKKTDPGQTTIEEHISEAEKTEAVKAFLHIMGEKPANIGASNNALQRRIVSVFDGITYDDPDGDPGARKIAGLYKHALLDEEKQPVRFVWVRVDAEADIPRLWYNAPLENFDKAATPPTFTGFNPMVPLLREAWGMNNNGKAPPPPAKKQPGNITAEDTALAGAGV